MRIIAGSERGRTLAAPKGDGTRPTTDRVRESLMSAIASARGGFENAVVLDAFAGSGALACEALSRGAAFACLCDQAGSALRIIRKNIDALGYDDGRTRMMRGDVLRGAVPRPPANAGGGSAAYDLVFLDPPYAMRADAVCEFVVSLDERGLLQEDAVISYEHDAADNDSVDAAFAALLDPCGFASSSRRTYGSTVIDIFTR